MNELTKRLSSEYEVAGAYIFTDKELHEFVKEIVERCALIAWKNTPNTEEMEYGHLISEKMLNKFGVND